MNMRLKLLLTIALALSLNAYTQKATLNSVKLFSRLPVYCNTPDAMALTKDGSILLSVPNFNNHEYPAVIMKVAMNGNSELFFPALNHHETGRGGPMGMEFGPDGNLYYADNQYFFDKNFKSRIIRIVMEYGKPLRSEVVVDNIKLANAVRWNGDYLYFSDTYFDLGDPKKVGYGGIYRIGLNEMTNNVVSLIADKTTDDPHLVVKTTCCTSPRGDNAGFDGICFDSNGVMYSGNFGDGQFQKVTFETPNGKVKDFTVIDKSLSCIDGICYDAKRDIIFITNSQDNGVYIWNIKECKMSKLWSNGDADGADGLLDQPCEPLIIGNKLYIANFDMPFPGLTNKSYDGIHTLSMIKLK